MMCPKCRSENNENSRFCSHCASPFPWPENPSEPSLEGEAENSLDLPPGSVFSDRYRIVEVLGHGGMGRVYKAFDAEIEEIVSLKLINPEITADRSTIERFQNELRLARRISHKNVCRLYHFSRSNGNYYITMEYVQGEDLKRMIRMTGQFNAAAAVDIAIQLCNGLAEAHSLGIIHLDLKSSNIMIDREGTVRIMDFGLARSLQEKVKTGAGALVGTPEYMSPEQVEGKPVDQRSDIYSLGVILYESVTGRVPFKGETPLHTAVKQKTESPDHPSRFNSLVPENLSCVILKCLEKNPAKRYQNIQEARADLNSIQGELSRASRSQGQEPAPAFQRFRSRFRRGWWAGATVILLSLLLRAYLFNREQNSAPPVSSGRVSLVVLPFENLGPPEDEYFADGLTEEITSRLLLLHGLQVTSRTSAQHYKATEKSIQQIGNELGVAYVLEGTVRWERGGSGEGRVRVTPRLIRVSDDTDLWSDIYDRVIGDILSLQSEIAEEVILQLDLTVLEPERLSLLASSTDSVEAHDCYLRATEHIRRAWDLREREAYLTAVELLERAVSLDPAYVFAYIQLSYAYQMLHFAGIDRRDELLVKARIALEKAESLDPELPFVKQGWAYFYYRALRDYDRALELYEETKLALPNFRTPVIGYIFRRQGKWDESLQEMKAVFEKDPRDPELACQIGNSYVRLRRFMEAEEWFQRSLDIAPDYLPSQLGRAEIPLLASGDIEATEARNRLISRPHPQLGYNRFYLAYCRRDYQLALEALSDTSGDAFYGFNYYLHKNLAHAQVYDAMQQPDLRRFHAEAARIALEQEVQEHPHDARVHSALGLTYAYLGRQAAAVQQGMFAVELEPVSLDAVNGPEHVLSLAMIYTIGGELDKAVEQLTYLMSIPFGTGVTAALLKVEPRWDPLRDLRGFQSLFPQQ